MRALVDNDVLYKGACFRMLDALVGEDRRRVGVLGAARFVLPRKILKARLKAAADGSLAELRTFITDAIAIEPTEDEQRLAARLELLAQAEGLRFDIGESQLCAVLVARDVPQLLTGDKRAIAALERLLDLESRIDPARGRVRCLEQLIHALLERLGIDHVRGTICSEPDVDRALAMCFSCHSAAHSTESVQEGLTSYIRAVRQTAERILASNP